MIPEEVRAALWDATVNALARREEGDLASVEVVLILESVLARLEQVGWRDAAGALWDHADLSRSKQVGVHLEPVYRIRKEAP